MYALIFVILLNEELILKRDYPLIHFSSLEECESMIDRKEIIDSYIKDDETYMLCVPIKNL